MKHTHYFSIIFCIFILSLTGCATTHHRYRDKNDSAPRYNIDISKIPNAVPKKEPYSKYGNYNFTSYVVLGKRYHVLSSSKGYDETGIASWYGMKFDKFRTSSGELYSVEGMSAASKTLPLPTYVQVTNLKNDKQVIVKVNDRGPFHENRIIDLSYVAAAKLGMLPTGTALVRVKAIDVDHPESIASVEEAPVPQPLIAGHPQIYLQLGAFRVESNAERLEEKVKEKTKYPVRVQIADKDHAPLYRVQIGPIPDVDNTDALHDELENAGLGEPMTVIQ